MTPTTLAPHVTTEKEYAKYNRGPGQRHAQLL